LWVVLNDDSLALAILENTYTAVAPTADFTSVQPLGVVKVTDPVTTAINRFPLVAAVNVQVCEVVPFCATDAPDRTVRFTHDDMVQL
jgi:hypothetical protein